MKTTVLLVPCALFVFNTVFAASDLWIRDDINDVGIEPNTLSPVMYLSDDIWVRRLADPNYDPQPFPLSSPTWVPLPHEGPCYRDPKTSSPNYMYVRVRNRGSTASSGTETLHVYWAKASTGLSWPGDWNDHLADPCATGTPRLYGYEVTKPRKNAATVSASVQSDYVTAVQTIDTVSFQFPDGVTYFDKQNGVHATLFNSGIHRSLRFLPWHREFINRYEALLREIKPALTLLYWDWTTDPSPTILGAGGFMGASSGAVGAPFSTFGISRNKPSGAPGVSGLQMSYQTGTLLPSTSYADFWGNNSFSAGIERPSHDQAHCYIDGTMCTGNAARDPMFFMLHANCDRLWAVWQRQNSANVDRWTPNQAYDLSQMDAAITSNLRPWDGTDGFSPWQNQIPGDPNGYVIFKTPTHHSIVYPPIYDDVLLKIPVLGANEACIIEIPFYPPPATECGSFVDPQHLCLLARIEPMPAPAETANLWQNVQDHNNIAWRNVNVTDCNVGPFFMLAPGLIGAAGELIRNLRDQPALITLRFEEINPGFRSLFQFGHLRLRLEQNLYDAWVRGGRVGQGIEPFGQNEILVFTPGAFIGNVTLDKREVGHMDVALQLNANYPEPFGDIYHLDILQYDDAGGNIPVGGQRYDLDFNLLSIVGKGSDWKYLDGGQVPPENWTAPDYDDEKWQTGSAPFGYGRTDVATSLRGSPTGRPPTAYFRQSFYVPDPSFFRNLAVNMLQDDGVVVYLNGKEIVRANMPTGAITDATLALTPMTGAAARACRSFDVSNALGFLNRGQNILAAELHWAAIPAQRLIDMTFDTELAANVPSTPYQPPTIVIGNPQDGRLFRAGTAVPIFADVLDPDDDLTEVRIYGDGQLLFRAEKPPFTSEFQPTAQFGAHRISVEADDRVGHRARMESQFTIVSNLPPIVQTSPIGEIFPSGVPVQLFADASDPDGSIVKVEFYVNQHMAFTGPQIFGGEDRSPPYEGVVANLPPGHYNILAVATDNQGARGFSNTGNFIVAPPAGSADITIRFDRYGGRPVITLLWEQHDAILERAPTLSGPWESVPDAPSSYALEPQRGGQEFYRLHLAHALHLQ